MKKHLTLIAVSALVLAVSCGKEFSEPAVTPAPAVSDGVEMTFHAFADPGTKTQLDGKHVLWSPKDEISVFYNSKNNKFTSDNTEPASTVDFSGVLSDAHAADGAGAKIFAAYPYYSDNECDGEYVKVTVPFIQNPEPGSLDQGALPSVAVTTTDDFYFYNVAGGIKLRFTRSDVSFVSVVSNAGEGIAGAFKVGFGADGVPYVKERVGYEYDYIWVYPGGGDKYFQKNTDYFVSIIPGELSAGLTLWPEVYDIETYKEYTQPLTVKRNVFGSISGFDKYMEYDYSSFPEAVDLGLSVLWGAANIGTYAPDTPGMYFSWGETEPKDYYVLTTYKWADGDWNAITKYASMSQPVLDPEDDPATVHLGPEWRTPSAAEFQELIDNCEWEWLPFMGAYYVTSKVPGYTNKSILLYASGFITDASQGSYFNDWLCYWTRDLYEEDPVFAKALTYYGEDAPVVSYFERDMGCTIRPVKDK